MDNKIATLGDRLATGDLLAGHGGVVPDDLLCYGFRPDL
jgi:hypothetical protein